VSQLVAAVRAVGKKRLTPPAPVLSALAESIVLRKDAQWHYQHTLGAGGRQSQESHAYFIQVRASRCLFISLFFSFFLSFFLSFCGWAGSEVESVWHRWWMAWYRRRWWVEFVVLWRRRWPLFR